jgi:hypothetical protein
MGLDTRWQIHVKEDPDFLFHALFAVYAVPEFRPYCLFNLGRAAEKTEIIYCLRQAETLTVALTKPVQRYTLNSFSVKTKDEKE